MILAGGQGKRDRVDTLVLVSPPEAKRKIVCTSDLEDVRIDFAQLSNDPG